MFGWQHGFLEGIRAGQGSWKSKVQVCWPALVHQILLTAGPGYAELPTCKRQTTASWRCLSPSKRGCHRVVSWQTGLPAGPW